MRNQHRVLGILAAITAIALVTGAMQSENAATRFEFTLSGAEEVPPNSSTGTGTAKVMIVGDKLRVDVSFEGLTGPLTGAHIHGPAETGEDADVILNIIPGVHPAGTGSPLRAMFDITDEQKEMIRSGLTYLNLHTAEFPGGEIRGQVD